MHAVPVVCGPRDDEYGSTAQVLFLHVKTDPCYNAPHGQFFIHTNKTETWATGSCAGQPHVLVRRAFRAFTPKTSQVGGLGQNNPADTS